jgi:hypothetical protein
MGCWGNMESIPYRDLRDHEIWNHDKPDLFTGRFGG